MGIGFFSARQRLVNIRDQGGPQARLAAQSGRIVHIYLAPGIPADGVGCVPVGNEGGVNV